MQNRQFILIPALLFALVFVAGCEPKGPIPGGELSGDITPNPETWIELNDTEVVQLEVNGPYSVNIWGVGTERGYYVAAAKGDETKWASKLSENSAVRLRIEKNIYELQAIRVSDEDEKAQVLVIYNSKYDLEANGDFPNAILYRLEAR